MQTYLVGGAVRDQLLGLAVREHDWVVVGATAQEMLAQGYRQVGKDFPVFLHPETHEEYALARTERKSAPGHLGFVVHADPEVTLEEDLQRRDLTINAIARLDDQSFVDPYGGLQDIEQRVLRHVSPAFSEDPLRVLRVARFAANLHDLGFVVAVETLLLMRRMAGGSELETLSKERVWRELEKALSGPHPEIFFEVLSSCGALESLSASLSEVVRDTFLDSLPAKALIKAVKKKSPTEIAYAALCASAALRARHASTLVCIDAVRAINRDFAAPKKYAELAILVVREFSVVANTKTLNASQLLDLLQSLDIYRRVDRFQDCLKVVDIIARIVRPQNDADTKFLETLATHLRALDTSELQSQALRGEQFAQALRLLRLQEIETLLKR